MSKPNSKTITKTAEKVKRKVTPALMLKAIGNNQRIAILQRLITHGECNVSQLNAVIKVSQPALSQHLAKLRKANLVLSRRESREVFYSIKDSKVLRVLGTINEMLDN